MRGSLDRCVAAPTGQNLLAQPAATPVEDQSIDSAARQREMYMKRRAADFQ